MKRWIQEAGLAMCVCLTCAVSVAQPPSFRVETDIYAGDAKQPMKQTLTLFSNGVYYDFAMDDSAAITVIDPQRDRIILLSQQRKVKTTLKMSQLLGLVAEAREQAAQQPATSEVARMLRAAERSSFDEQTQVVTVGDESLRYDATLQQPRDPSMAAQYADFADWSARLNAVYPPRLLPYVRLELNRQIAARSMLPQQITRTERHNRKEVVWRTRLLPNWRISSDDESKLNRVGELLSQCQEVSIQEYIGGQAAIATQAAAAPKQR
jgi:hypothetical protein